MHALIGDFVRVAGVVASNESRPSRRFVGARWYVVGMFHGLENGDVILRGEVQK